MESEKFLFYRTVTHTLFSQKEGEIIVTLLSFSQSVGVVKAFANKWSDDSLTQPVITDEFVFTITNLTFVSFSHTLFIEMGFWRKSPELYFTRE